MKQLIGQGAAMNFQNVVFEFLRHIKLVRARR